jgi:hypothetical protein
MIVPGQVGPQNPDGCKCDRSRLEHRQYGWKTAGGSGGFDAVIGFMFGELEGLRAVDK